MITEKECLRSALIGIKINESNKEIFRTKEQIKKALLNHNPRILKNLYSFIEIQEERILRLKNNNLNDEEEFILNLEVLK